MKLCRSLVVKAPEQLLILLIHESGADKLFSTHTYSVHGLRFNNHYAIAR